jgi:hypothetical protein
MDHLALRDITMKKFGLLLMLIVVLCASSVTVAQDEGEIFRVEVRVESTFARIAPSPEAEPVASLFDNEWLDVVGRNLDGIWFEVRRPDRLTNLGWVFSEMLEDWEFRVEDLPLTDMTTGILGPAPLAQDPGFAVHVLENVVMRRAPSLQAERITTVPHSVTIPLLARNQDGSWLQVNYLGYEGWIVGFTTRELPDVMVLPLALGLTPLTTLQVETIPLEIQLAHLNRLRDFLVWHHRVASDLANFWWLVSQGEIVPCNPPALVSEYLISLQDVRELPELHRHVPRVNEGIEYLNAAIEPLQNCGVLTPRAVTDARNAAINAGVIFDATLDQLDTLEESITQ